MMEKNAMMETVEVPTLWKIHRKQKFVRVNNEYIREKSRFIFFPIYE